MTEPEEAALEGIVSKVLSHRERVIVKIFKEAAKRQRKVWGYCSNQVGAQPMLGSKVPKTWDRICVEGDEQWTLLPREVPK